MHLAVAFIQSELQSIQDIIFFVSMCVPWELNPRPFALLTQCSSTESQEHIVAVFTGTLVALNFIYFIIALFFSFDSISFCNLDNY